jgi:D-glycero-D-manno-heptose 1,7-bisphosphate phosphatase
MAASQPLPPKTRHVILDRDGVLNREPPDLSFVLSAAQFHWLPGARAALALLHAAGMRLSVASNQSAVGRGLMDLAQLDGIMAHMRAGAADGGGAIDAVFYCPHAPDAGCDCRKPQPGLIDAAVKAAGIDAGQTLFVGDAVRDVEAALAAGVAPVLVRTGKGSDTELQLQQRGIPVPVFADLLQFARALTGVHTCSTTESK